ncbi:hypothetical protein BC832DRAFT_357478 [Gaertneriomyces semiglobifer]|nr:hypothetical protein BC832DRAFT_357478 [Gaertneriomyces semiglobifer]
MQTRDQFADGVERLMKTQVEVLKSFVSEELDLTEQGIAKLEGATWLTSYALAAGWTSAEDSETIVNALHQAVVIAANKRELEASYPVILQSYNRAIRAMATDAPSGIVTTHVENALQTLTTASSSVRFAYLLALSTLVGQHNTGDPNTSVDASLLRRVVEVLYDQLVNGEPKSSRIAGWIFGKIASEMVANEEAQAMEDLIGLSGGGRNMRKDPPNYNRLNQGSSYLRAVFDSLVSGTIHREVCAKLLGCLIHVDAALPAVDWNVVFKVAENMDASEDSTRDQRLCDLCFALATIQAVYGSGSAIEYVISHIATLVREPTASLRILNLPMAIGVLLKLGGLSTESQNTYEARVAVAPSKVIEIFQAAVHRVFGDDDVSSRLRLKFIQTMSPFLRVPVDVAASPRAALLRSMILQELVSGHGYLPEEVVDEDATAAVKELAGCVAFDKQAIQALMTQHFDHNKAALGWTPKGLWCFGKLVEIAVTENKEKPWLADMLAACMKQPSPAMEALLMNVLRQVIASHGVELQQVAVHASISTIQSMLSLDPHGEIGRYIVRMLDIALMICASSDKEAAQPVDVVWSLALGGLNWLWLSMQRGDKEPVPRAFGPVAGSEIVLWLTSLIAEDETTSTRDQVWFKRTYCGASMHMERLIGKITIDRKTSCPPVRVYQIQVEPKQ